MQSILVPTDGSEAAEKAFGVALDLALQHGATIKVLHVLLRNKEPGELLRLPEVSVAGQEVVRELKRLEEMPVAPPSVEQIMTNPDAVLRPASELVLRMIGAHVLKRASARAAEAPMTPVRASAWSMTPVPPPSPSMTTSVRPSRLSPGWPQISKNW